MNKEQIKEQIESIFNTPKAWEMVKNIYGNVTVDEQILKVDYIIDQIVTLTQHHEAQVLKEQIERVKPYLNHKGDCLIYRDNYLEALMGGEDVERECNCGIEALKAELEGEQ